MSQHLKLPKHTNEPLSITIKGGLGVGKTYLAKEIEASLSRPVLNLDGHRYTVAAIARWREDNLMGVVIYTEDV